MREDFDLSTGKPVRPVLFVGGPWDGRRLATPALTLEIPVTVCTSLAVAADERGGYFHTVTYHRAKIVRELNGLTLIVECMIPQKMEMKQAEALVDRALRAAAAALGDK